MSMRVRMVMVVRRVGAVRVGAITAVRMVMAVSVDRVFAVLIPTFDAIMMLMRVRVLRCFVMFRGMVFMEVLVSSVAVTVRVIVIELLSRTDRQSVFVEHPPRGGTFTTGTSHHLSLVDVTTYCADDLRRWVNTTQTSLDNFKLSG